MVLQRNKPIPVWGWADANEKIEVHFNKQILKIKADKTGKWMVRLNAEIAGGPYEMSIKDKNEIVLKDVLVGEVWICSGQSNMEFTVDRAMNAKQEINDSDFPMIRQFMVEKDLSASPKSELKAGKWDVCGKTTVGNFTAVGYFFAKKLYTELKIPIGIINTSWGGTCVETWTSREAFEKVIYNKRTGEVEIVLETRNEFTPTAFLRSNEELELNFEKVRGSYMIPLKENKVKLKF